MRILSVHNLFRQYAGSDVVASSDEKLLSERAQVSSYSRNSNEIAAVSGLQKVLWGLDTIYSRRTDREVTSLVQQFRPDIAYVHNVFPLISPSLFHTLHRMRVPSVHMIHDFRLWCPNSRFYVNNQPCRRCLQQGNYWPALENRCIQGKLGYSAAYAASLSINRQFGFTDKITGFICLTEFAKKLLIECQVPEEKIFICPNHIDTSLFTPQYGKGDYVLYLGGLYQDKGVMTVVKAFAKLPHIPVKFVGAGDAEQEMRDYIRQHRLSNIELVGFKGGEEKREYLRNSLFTICATHCYETFGLVVLEAYASGKPCIASAIGALPYIVEPQKTGLLFEPQNSDDLAEKIQWLYERPADIECMGRQARATVESKYDTRLRYAALNAIFEQVIERSQMN